MLIEWGFVLLELMKFLICEENTDEGCFMFVRTECGCLKGGSWCVVLFAFFVGNCLLVDKE